MGRRRRRRHKISGILCSTCIAGKCFIAARKASLLQTGFFRYPPSRHECKRLKTQCTITLPKAVRYWGVPFYRSLVGNHATPRHAFRPPHQSCQREDVCQDRDDVQALLGAVVFAVPLRLRHARGRGCSARGGKSQALRCSPTRRYFSAEARV